MKRIIYILTIVLAASCAGMKDPYEGSLHLLSVTAQYPAGYEGFDLQGSDALVEEINTGSRYSALTDASGSFSMTLPDGIYRVNISGRYGSDVFNGAADKVVLSGADLNLKLPLSYSKAGSIVIKEIYCGGCKKLPQEGDYQGDQYFILHNNDYNVQYLDSLCFGTLSPNNATASNPWVSKDPATGESIFPDFLPIIQAVWQFPGDGDDFPLQPGQDAVICLRGAIDHSLQYPLSVNLNKPDYFVCYNLTYFWNTAYHPAPGNLISEDRIIDVVIKTGQANAYTFSLNSPTLVIWKAEGMTIQEFVNLPDNVTPVPGSSIDNVVKIPYEWIYDAVEVFDARSANNSKRLAPSADAGYVLQTDVFLGHSLMRHIDKEASAASGYEVLTDTNNSLNDFYESEKQSLHE
jgi:hypothetical protein